MDTINHPYRETAAVSPIVDIIRIVLGAILLIMGIRFGGNPHDVLGTVGNHTGFMSLFVVHYIVMCHLVGGVLLVLGLISRIAAIVQIPILIGAVIFAIIGDGYGSIYTQFWFPLVVLAMLFVVSYYGSGRYSLDEAMRERRKAH